MPPQTRVFGHPQRSLVAFGHRCRQARRHKKMSLEQACVAIGLSRPTMSLTERGRRNPRPWELGALAQAYGVEVAWLVGDLR
jgi:transcriptional regulator with XRE-family HTH domain